MRGNKEGANRFEAEEEKDRESSKREKDKELRGRRGELKWRVRL